MALDENKESNSDEEATTSADGLGESAVSSADLLARATVDLEEETVERDDVAQFGNETETDWDVAPAFRESRRRLQFPRKPNLRHLSSTSRSKTSANSPSAPPAPKGGYRVRRVRRLVRHIEPWSVLKVSVVFYLCVWGLMVIAVRMLWSAAEEAGTIEKVESFIEELFALETFEFDTSQIFRIFVLGGLVFVVGGIGVTVVLVVLFNLISDLTGGLRFTMVEEETAVRQRRVRRGDVLVDDSLTSSDLSLDADTVSRSPGL